MTTITLARNAVKENPLFKLYRHYIIDSILIVKNEGFKALAKKRGKKFFMIIVGYYLVRDTLVYIVLPALIARGLI